MKANKEMTERIIKLREQGLSLVQIAKQVGLSHQRVSVRLRNQGYKGMLLKRYCYECLFCHSEFLSRYSNSTASSARHRFCSLKCQHDYRFPAVIYKGAKEIIMNTDDYNVRADFKNSRNNLTVK